MLHVHQHSEELLQLIAKTVKGATKWKVVGVTTKFWGLVVIDGIPGMKAAPVLRRLAVTVLTVNRESSTDERVFFNYHETDGRLMWR